MKLKQKYNLASFDRFLDSDKKPGFQDAAPGVILSRQLTAVDPKIFEKKFPALALVNSGIQIDNSGGFARRIQSLRVTEQGGFTTAGDKSGNKGKISLAGEDSFLNVIVREAGSNWSDDEVKEADLQGINLVTRFLSAHNSIYNREIDEIGLVGKDGIDTGLLNNAFFVSGSATGVISTLTAQQMYDEIATLITEQHSAVNNTPEYMADAVIMPTRVANVLRATILNTANGAMSVYRALELNFPQVSFSASHRADTVANGGSLSASAVAAYSTNTESMVMRIPVPLTVSEIVKVGGFDYQVDSKYRIAGLDILETTAGRILTGL